MVGRFGWGVSSDRGRFGIVGDAVSGWADGGRGRAATRVILIKSVIKSKSASVQTLYIDHSIVTHKASWEDLRRAIERGKVRLALSVSNLVEIGCATDEAQRERRLTFLIDDLLPVWVIERRAIQRQEVERFLWQHQFGVAPRELIAITSSLSVVDSFFAGVQTRIGLTARQFIRETDFASLHPLKRLSPDALRTFQSADRRTLKCKEKEIFNAWIGPSIPNRGPDGRALTTPEKAKLLAFCWQRKRQFFVECRCLAVEDALTTARTGNAMRQPTESDGPDLQHAAVALAYCDIFYSRDGYQTQCAVAARKVLESIGLGAVCSTPAELADAIAAL